MVVRVDAAAATTRVLSYVCWCGDSARLSMVLTKCRARPGRRVATPVHAPSDIPPQVSDLALTQSRDLHSYTRPLLGIDSAVPQPQPVLLHQLFVIAEQERPTLFWELFTLIVKVMVSSEIILLQVIILVL